ncbi:MAG: type II toxin-antitoxin system RelE/ParE family toxin [Chloroflexi bacterium]|nr:type II toxin-antitoxin system RelE/ParE family toxin [Chloroflexota bacterium]
MQISLSDQARKDLRALDPPVARRITRAIERFGTTNTGDLKRLKGQGGEYRLRVGDWRVRFVFQDSTTILTLRVLNHREAYRES